ncbi:MAG: GNAT family N-acetyltransferase [Hyphomicrobiales bacterium]
MTDLPLTIRHETPADAGAIEKLHERAFGPGRYAKTAYRLREGVAPIASLSFVALVGTLVVGSIRLTPITIGQTPALLLGPLAVEQAFSSIGIGMSLIQRAVETAKAEGHQLILLVGDEPYYNRAGFVVMPKGRAEMPGPVDPQRVLVLELVPDALVNVSGRVASVRLNAA